MLYQLSYFRLCGRRWIRTTEGINQQIYSLPHLATLVFSRLLMISSSMMESSMNFEPMEGIEPTTPRLQITCSSQLSYIGISFLQTICFPKGIAKIDINSDFPKLFEIFCLFSPFLLLSAGICCLYLYRIPSFLQLVFPVR